jgi:hypothetical protein
VWVCVNDPLFSFYVQALILDDKRDNKGARQKVLTNTITYLLRRRAIDAGLNVIGMYIPVPLSKLLSFCQSRVVQKLVLRLGDEKKKVKAKSALVLIATALDPQKSLADFLKESFLGIDDFLCHKKIMPDKQPLEKKLRALRSIGELIELIEPHLSNFHLKIIHTLKVAEKVILRRGTKTRTEYIRFIRLNCKKECVLLSLSFSFIFLLLPINQLTIHFEKKMCRSHLFSKLKVVMFGTN